MDQPSAADPGAVLSQPTRARLFALVTELKRPVGTLELAQELGLHPNGVRVHLERMERAGLLVRAQTRQGRGRPRDAWTVAPDARPSGAPPSAYADLGRWLARATAPDPGRLREIEAAGREIGQELAPSDSAVGATETLHMTLAALGFAPRQERTGEARVKFCLDNCPYRDAARDHQEIVCTLHLGITRGLLDVLDPDATLAAFVPHDPDTAGCVIEVTGAGHG